MHALGVVAAAYNQLEFYLWCFFRIYVGISSEMTSHLFVTLTNNSRVDLITKSLELMERDPVCVEQVSYFLKCFNLCAESRNFLMHATVDTNDSDTMLTLTKASRNNPTTRNQANLTLDEIRGVADDCYNVVMFGHELYLWKAVQAAGGSVSYAGTTYTQPLPDKPALPRRLNLSRP